MFRFGIRDVLWLTVVVGMGVGWQIDRTRIESRRQEAVDEASLSWGLLEISREDYRNLREVTAPYFACYPQPCLFCGRAPGDGKGEVPQTNSN
jgi:hypothetical protein